MQSRFDSILADLAPGGPLLLAVSGGADSIVMLDLFSNSRTAPDFTVAHCNFHLRGSESDADAAFVEDCAAAISKPFLRADFDTLAHARTKGISIEMAARELRYNWFAERCAGLGLFGVATAHNANDNAETLLLNLLRGTGPKGLSGMKEDSPLQGSPTLRLLRPLLGFTKKEIYEYAAVRRLSWREDSTNADTSYKRNLLRNQVFPLFEKLNPSFLKTLASDAEHFSQVQAIADDHCQQALGRIRTASSDSDFRISIPALKAEKHRDYLLFAILNPLGFTASAISDLSSLLEKAGDPGAGTTLSGKTFLSPSHSALTSSGEIIVSKRSFPFSSVDGSQEDRPGVPRSGSRSDAVEVGETGAYSLKGVGFKVSVLPVSAFEKVAGNGFRIRLPEGVVAADAGRLPFPFTVRGWREGDWMRPIGLGGKKKISDLFVSLRFSLPQKESALLVQGEGSRVLALLGKRVDEAVMATESTSSLIVFELL